MGEYYFAYIIFVLYLSFVLGIAVKFHIKGVRQQIIIAPIIPFFILASVFKTIKRINEKQDNVAFITRITNIRLFFQLAFMSLPSLVGLIGFSMAEAEKKAKENKRKKIKKPFNKSSFLNNITDAYFNTDDVLTKLV